MWSLVLRSSWILEEDELAGGELFVFLDLASVLYILFGHCEARHGHWKFIAIELL